MAGRITKSDEQLRPDPRYQDKVLAKFINCVMWDGKKSIAQRVVYDALDEMQKRLDKDRSGKAKGEKGEKSEKGEKGKGGDAKGRGRSQAAATAADANLPETALEMFHKAIDNVKPEVEVRSKRVGGANYQVPMQVTARRRQSLAFRWILQATRGESGRPMAQRLARELYDAAKREGKAITTKENTHRMAEANKAFAHFAW